MNISKAKYYIDRISTPKACVCDEWDIKDIGSMAWKRKRWGTPVYTDEVPRARIREIVSNTVKLIKTIKPNYHPKVAQKIYLVVIGKTSTENVIRWCTRTCGISEGRARIIVSDQVTKVLELVKLEAWKNKGIKYVIWKHSGEDKDPRDYHERKWDGRSGILDGNPNGLNGFIFAIDRPPIIDKNSGKRGYPSTLIGCKCYLQGVRE